MRAPHPTDADLVSAVGWTQTNVLFSVADDKCIQSWSIDGEPLAKVCDIDCFATDFHWLVAPGAADSEVLALASGDGTFCFPLHFSNVLRRLLIRLIFRTNAIFMCS